MLLKLVPSVRVGEPHGTELWMFGSAYSREAPRDIDLLLVYDEARVSPHDAIDARQRLANAVAEQTERPADILLLSRQETTQTGLLTRVAAIRLV